MVRPRGATLAVDVVALSAVVLGSVKVSGSAATVAVVA